MSSLDRVLQHPAIWRGNQYAKVSTASIPTGFDELDALLPGGGWPRAALTELLASQEGIGELRLLAPALACLSKGEKWLVLVSPPHVPYAPAFESLGVDLSRLVVVNTKSDAETWWAAERCLRSCACAAVLAWPRSHEERAVRRLQLAVEEGKGLGVVFAHSRVAAHPSPAALRIQLHASRRRLEIQIIKRRGGGWAPQLSLDLDRTRVQRRLTIRTASRAPTLRRVRQGNA
ncbi:MAG TPA: translesion DNA synthesis-associated protein ImuA [Burkholderiales bacterium]|nr:translesion DNA synthesis-associated protein ImuA [Burkholderiales bacterium]